MPSLPLQGRSCRPTKTTKYEVFDAAATSHAAAAVFPGRVLALMKTTKMGDDDEHREEEKAEEEDETDGGGRGGRPHKGPPCRTH